VALEIDPPQTPSENKAAPVQTDLSDREIQVLRLVAAGSTNLEIADILCISPHTVKSHVVHILNKLGVNDRTEAAVWAVRHHLA
jgi:DNA-binding NarL/FixJ family response regulator